MTSTDALFPKKGPEKGSVWKKGDKYASDYKSVKDTIVRGSGDIPGVKKDS